MDAARKSIEMSSQVRQSAEDIKNVMNDLYSWEKEIKDKEKQLQSNSKPQDANLNEKKINVPPVPRSHILELGARKNDGPQLNDLSGAKGKQTVDSPTEKRDTAVDPLQLKHKEANEIKDRGNTYVKAGKYALAIDEYTAAIDVYPNDSVYYCNRALCYLKLERYDECIEDCDRATDIDNLAVKAYYRRMMANESLGNNMDALKDCTTVLMIEPKNGEASRSLERINERLRKSVKTTNGPNFSTLRSNLVDILPIDKPAYKRSNKPLKRVPIADVVGPKESKNHENLKISDEDIDKLFNSNCGYFEEIKNPEAHMKAKENAANQKSELNKSIAKSKEEKNVKSSPTNESAVSKESENTEKKKAVDVRENSNKLAANVCVATTVTDTAAGDSVKNTRPLPAAPKSTAQFYSNWKELSLQQKYQYLKSIQTCHLCKILGAGFDSDTLTDVIRTLHDFYLPAKDPALASTLLEVSKNKQLPILSLLMSNEERKALSEMVNSLRENNSLDGASTAAEQIMKNFNLV